MGLFASFLTIIFLPHVILSCKYQVQTSNKCTSNTSWYIGRMFHGLSLFPCDYYELKLSQLVNILPYMLHCVCILFYFSLKIG
jgi:hypothetical protein